MNVLLDSCIAGSAAAVVRAAGHDVLWTGDWPTDPGDDQILQFAVSESRVLVTIDKDFGELVLAQGLPHAGLIRLIGFRAAQQGPRLLHSFWRLMKQN